MSPILVRPIREQLEHDRIIRLLVAKYKRRYTVAINPGAEQNAPVGSGMEAQYPDLVLTPSGHSRKVVGIVEVETGESVNYLEAMAQWGPYGRFPIEFVLYVPAGSADVARRLCADNRVGVTEIWGYHAFGDQMRFTQLHRAPIEKKLAASAAAERAARKAAAGTNAPGRRARPVATEKRATPKKTPIKPSSKAKAAPRSQTAGRHGSAKPAAAVRKPAARRAAKKR